MKDPGNEVGMNIKVLTFVARVCYKKVCVLRWSNTVFARAFADVIQRTHKDWKKQICR